MINEHEDIVELVECRPRQANEYLEHGYKLLGLFGFTATGHHPDGELFVRRGTNCILGRTKSVEHHEPERPVKKEG
jgi:hypothetical protein